jgi:hypothetical protein
MWNGASPKCDLMSSQGSEYEYERIPTRQCHNCAIPH